MFWSLEGMRFVLQDVSRRELSYTGRLKRRATLPVKWAPQSLRPRHLPFDLLHPPYRGLLHTFFNPLPSSLPSHQIKQTGCLLQRNAISTKNVAITRSLSFSNHFTQVFFFFFDAFLLSTGRKTWAGVHQSGWDMPFSAWALFDPSCPWQPDPLCVGLLSSALSCLLSPLHFYFYPNRVSLETGK